MKPQPNIVQGVGFSLTICFLLIQSEAAAENSCHVVLAQSSIPNAGFGVYALQDYDLGDPIVSLTARSCCMAHFPNYLSQMRFRQMCNHCNYRGMQVLPFHGLITFTSLATTIRPQQPDNLTANHYGITS